MLPDMYSSPTKSFQMEGVSEDLLPELTKPITEFTEAYTSLVKTVGNNPPCMFDSEAIASCLNEEAGPISCMTEMGQTLQMQTFQSNAEPSTDQTIGSSSRQQPTKSDSDENKIEVNYDEGNSIIVTTAADGQLASVENVSQQGGGRKFLSRSKSHGRMSSKRTSTPPGRSDSEEKGRSPRSMFARSPSTPDLRQISPDKRQPPVSVMPKRTISAVEPRHARKAKNIKASQPVPKRASTLTQQKASCDDRKVAAFRASRKSKEAPVRYFRGTEESKNDNGSTVHMIQLQRIEF